MEQGLRSLNTQNPEDLLSIALSKIKSIENRIRNCSFWSKVMLDSMLFWYSIRLQDTWLEFSNAL